MPILRTQNYDFAKENLALTTTPTALFTVTEEDLSADDHVFIQSTIMLTDPQTTISPRAYFQFEVTTPSESKENLTEEIYIRQSPTNNAYIQPPADLTLVYDVAKAGDHIFVLKGYTILGSGNPIAGLARLSYLMTGAF